MEFITQPWFIAFAFLLVANIAGFFFFRFQLKKLHRIQHAMELILKELIKTKESTKKKFGELHSVSLGTGQKILELEKRIINLDEQQQEMTVQAPENKLYSRAVKMVELGADLHEIMTECELPKAEAELLISLHRHKNG